MRRPRQEHHCHLCGFMGKSEFELNRHKKTKRHLKKEGSPTVDERKNRYYCAACNYRTTNVKNWEKHVARPEHTAEPFKPMLCPNWWCTCWSTDPMALEEHAKRCRKGHLDLWMPILPQIPPASTALCALKQGMNGMRQIYECAKRDASYRLLMNHYKSEYERKGKNEYGDPTIVIDGKHFPVAESVFDGHAALFIQTSDGTVVTPKNKQAAKIWHALEREIDPNVDDKGPGVVVDALKNYLEQMEHEQVGPMQGPAGSLWYFRRENGEFGRPADDFLRAMKLLPEPEPEPEPVKKPVDVVTGPKTLDVLMSEASGDPLTAEDVGSSTVVEETVDFDVDVET